MATIIKTDGTEEKRGDLVLTDCQEIIGGWPKPIYLEDHIMLVDEDGIPKCLPINEKASMYAHQNIYGTAVWMDLVEGARVLGYQKE